MRKFSVRNLFFASTICIFGITASSAQARLTLADAQKAYVAGDWKLAATAYEQACPSQPAKNRTECMLWNVLALSQTGSGKDFNKASRRLDSLINKTDSKNAVYTDLMMTKAQFQLYLGNYNRAGEILNLAIGASHPHQVAVLKKVCSAVQPRAKSESLNFACANLGSPAKSQTAEKKTAAKATAAATQPKTTDAVAATSQTNKATSTGTPTSATAKESWYLQLGAFGVKTNADLLVSNLAQRDINCTIENRKIGEKSLFIVQTGNFGSKDMAMEFGNQKLAPINIEFQPVLKK